MRTFLIMIGIWSFCTSWCQKIHYPSIPQDSTLLEGKKKFLSEKKTTPGKRPNVILIVADDLGKYDLSVYGNTFIETPHIDRLAKEGVLFTDGYATAPICSPSRAGFLTGRYQQRFGYHLQPHQRYPRNHTEWWLFKHLVNTSYMEPARVDAYPAREEIPKMGLPSSEITLAELLKKEGYATAWVGKWHLGYAAPLLPKNFGFDYSYGFLEAFSLFADPGDPQIVNARINEFTDKHIWRQGRKGHCAIYENDQLIHEKEYITYAFARKAQEFITQHKDEPFFIYLPVTAPHTPYQAPREIYERLSHIPQHNKRVYYAMIIALDNAVGNIIAHLQKEGLEENTLIIFTSDNGAALYSETVTNAPLAGGKMTFYEGGVNVPFMMYYKNRITPGTIVQQPVSLLDIFATVAETAGTTLPGDRPIDGVSLWPWISGKRTDGPHPQLYWWSDYNMGMRRGSWKYILNTLDATRELYHLGNDRGETADLSITEPVITGEMHAILLAWCTAMPAMLWPRIMDYTIEVNGKQTRWAI